MQVTMKATRLFFDQKKVLQAIGKANAKALSKAGAFVRRGARSSIRRRKAVSAPGSPPSAHSTDKVATIKNILFAYEPRSRSVVVGPVLLNGRRQAGVVPETLEFGGAVAIHEKRVGTVWRSIGRRKPRPGQPTRVRQARYRKRPFMGPALEREAPKFPDLWGNSVRGN